jgi:hypothetical protein
MVNGVELTPPEELRVQTSTTQGVRSRVQGMERSSKRGKIPQQDWPSIIKRYEAGETLASIARTYACSPPAISYILSRSRARDATAEAAEQSRIGAEETQLVKGSANEMSATESSGRETDLEKIAAHAAEPLVPQAAEGLGRDLPPDEPRHSPEGVADAFDRGAEIVVQQVEVQAAVPGHTDRRPNGTSPGTIDPADALSQNGEPRRTLHLPLSQVDAHSPDPQPHGAGASAPEHSAVRLSGGQQHRLFLPSGQPNPSAGKSAANGGAIRMAPESHRARDGGAFIDQALRARVEGDVTAFLDAFDAALANDTAESRTGLREATDRLLRAGARTRIELERLEARIPLPFRDSGDAPPIRRPR